MPSGVPRLDRIYEQQDRSKDFKPIAVKDYFAAPERSNGAQAKYKGKFGGNLKQGRGSK